MTAWLRLLACALLAALLAACGTSSKRGGYYQDDGPGSNIPANIASIPDAVPRIEPYARANMRPYSVMGRYYVPISDGRSFSQEGVASWYGRKFHGQRTANGERYDMYAMTAAHPTLPLPSYARVTRMDNGRSVIVRINDRGPFLHSRIIDLSYAAAAKLDYINHGSTRVRVEAITHDEIRLAQRRGTPLAGSPAIVSQASAAPSPRPAIRVGTAQSLSVESSSMPTAQSETPDALAVIPVSGDDSFGTPQPMPVTASAEPRQMAVTSTGPPAGGFSSQIYLQFGAFSAASSAQGLAQRLNAQIGRVESRPAHIQEINGLHRVRIGPYPNRTEAVNAAVRIQEQTGKQATIALQ